MWYQKQNLTENENQQKRKRFSVIIRFLGMKIEESNSFQALSSGNRPVCPPHPGGYDS